MGEKVNPKPGGGPRASELPGPIRVPVDFYDAVKVLERPMRVPVRKPEGRP